MPASCPKWCFVHCQRHAENIECPECIAAWEAQPKSLDESQRTSQEGPPIISFGGVFCWFCVGGAAVEYFSLSLRLRRKARAKNKITTTEADVSKTKAD